MTTLELWIKRHRRRLAVGVFLQRAGEWLAWFLFLFGACVLTTKLFLPEWWPHVLWLGLLVIPILALAVRAAIRAPFSHTEAVALLDRQLKGGGLIMSLAEADDPNWHDRLPKTPHLWRRKLPKIRPVRFLRLIGWPAVFALGALLIPLRNPNPAMAFSTEVGQQATSQLSDLVGLLETSHVLKPEETAEMKAVIEQLSTETQHAPLTSEKWETIDHLRQTLTSKLTQDEATVANAGQVVSKLLNAEGGNLQELLTDNQASLEKVAELLSNLKDKDALPELPGGMAPQWEQLLKQGQMQLANDPELRKQVFGQAQKLLENRSGDLNSIRSKFQQAFAQMPNRDGTGTQAADSNNGTQNPSTGASQTVGNANQMKWGQESGEKQAKFQQIVLPPGYLDDPTNKVAGVSPSQRTPKTAKPSENVATQRPTEFEPATGREVRSRELRPHDRKLVKEYFRRKNASPESGTPMPSAGE